MEDDFALLISSSGQVTVDLSVGHLSQLSLQHNEDSIDVLHIAPWLNDPGIQKDHDIALTERLLCGDFLCAPFGGHALPDAPIHGWSANSRWQQINRPYFDGVEPTAMKMQLDSPVQGAKVIKELALGRGAPILYQSHQLIGGMGHLPVATHPMFDVPSKARITMSPKVLALTPSQPIEPDAHRLKYPATGSDLHAFPGRDKPIDILVYPDTSGADDLVTLVEAPGSRLGWTAITRDKDVVFVLKDPSVLPVTMLWFSNGGRQFSPWNGRHLNVLGVEDGRVPTDATGVPRGFALSPKRTQVINHAIGAIARPSNWNHLSDLRVIGEDLVLTGDTGERVFLPFAPHFFDA